MDVSILKTIHALRNKDESIYDPSSRFFPEHSDIAVREKRHKPKHFKDVLREQILEQMQKEDEEHEVEKDDEKDNPLQYNQEQKELEVGILGVYSG